LSLNFRVRVEQLLINWWSKVNQRTTENTGFALGCLAGADKTFRMALRNVIKISVTPSAKTVIADIAEKNGMREMWVASRVYEWFGAQDDVLRKAILQVLPEGYEVDVVRMALEKFAAAKGKPKK